jgi:hypothetical protein
MAKSIEPPYEKISLRGKAAAKSSNTDQTAVPKGTEIDACLSVIRKSGLP